MKPTRKPPPDSAPLLCFGAHPDDIEFGCGGIVARETRAGRRAHFVICSRGEAGTHGTPRMRTAEARKAGGLLGATVEFIELDGDARLEIRLSHSMALARIIRRLRPAIVLAPSLTENQHPDHYRLGRMARDAARLARYGNLKDLKARPAHSISQLFFYAVSPDAEPSSPPVLIDISDPGVVAAWTAAMKAHASQAMTRDYAELHLTRARLHGFRAGVRHAQPLFPNDALVFDSLAPLTRSARRL